MASVFGAVIIITVLEHYFSKYFFHLINPYSNCFSVLAGVVIAIGYSYFAAFYRASAREVKRLGNYCLSIHLKHLTHTVDSLLRSLLYSHFSESLTGLPTIRSYGEMNRFIRDNHYYVDLEDRALFLTITNQRCVIQLLVTLVYSR